MNLASNDNEHIDTAGFVAALTALGRPALLVREDGRIVRANAAGWNLAAESPSLQDELRVVIAHRAPRDFEVIRLALREPHYLVVRRAAPPSILQRLESITKAWALTRRQRQVLGLMAEGHLNKTIADRLNIVTGTVELHVTGLYRKAGVSNRTALIARFWSEAIVA